MDQETFEREEKLNRAAWESLRDQIRRDHAHQYVGIAEGRLIAAADTFDDVEAAIRQLQPVPEYYLIFPGDEDPIFEGTCLPSRRLTSRAALDSGPIMKVHLDHTPRGSPLHTEPSVVIGHGAPDLSRL